MEKAVKNKLTPLLHRYLLCTSLSIPPHISGKLAKSAQIQKMRNINYLSEIDKINILFTEEGINLILLKGAALLKTVYSKDIAVRPMNDVDILVKKEDVEKAHDLLIKSDYQMGEEELDKSFYMKNHFHISYTKNGNIFTTIELHWDLFHMFSPTNFDIEDLWEDVVHLENGVLTFSPENLLIYLALHLAGHGFCYDFILERDDWLDIIFSPNSMSVAIWFYDIFNVFVYYQDKFDWDKILNKCLKWNTLESFVNIIMITERLFHITILPENIREKAQCFPNRFCKRILNSVIIRLTCKNSYTKTEETFRKLCTMEESLQFRPLRVFDIPAFLIPSKSFIKGKYHSKLNIAFLYFFHFFKGLFTVGKVLLDTCFNISRKKLSCYF